MPEDPQARAAPAAAAASAPTARQRRLGIALVTAATLCFALLDTVAKWLVQSLPAEQVVGMRFATHVLLMTALLLPWHGRALFRLGAPKLHLLRGTMLAAMTALNFFALRWLQLAETGAIQFSVPLLIAVLSAWWLGERLDARRWIAIVAGFAGVLLVVRPGSHAFHPAIVLSIVQAFIYAAFNLLTRRMTTTDSAESMQLVSAVVATAWLAPFMLAAWQWPAGAAQWTLLFVCGFFGGVGHLAVAAAHRHASAAVLGPFLYQQIVYMTLCGWLVFGQVPDAFVVAGAAVVVGSGLYLLWLEMRRR